MMTTISAPQVVMVYYKYYCLFT